MKKNNYLNIYEKGFRVFDPKWRWRARYYKKNEKNMIDSSLNTDLDELSAKHCGFEKLFQNITASKTPVR